MRVKWTEKKQQKEWVDDDINDWRENIFGSTLLLLIVWKAYRLCQNWGRFVDSTLNILL